MDFERSKEIDKLLEKNSIPLNFVSYGIGGGFYNNINRDYLGWAMKTSYSNGGNRMKFTANPIKRSIPGIVAIYRDNNGDLVVGKESSVNAADSIYETIIASSLLRMI